MRRRSREIWAAHLAVVDGEAVGKREFETDRARFLGRGGGVRTPIAVIDGRPLSNTVGTVLDPIFAAAPPGADRAGRDGAHRLLDDGRRPRARSCSISSTSIATSRAFERAATLAWTQAQVQLHHLGIDRGRGGAIPASGRHICSMPHRRCARRPTPSGAGAVDSRVCGRWAYPAICRSSSLRISDIENLDVARELLQAHEYWRMKQLAVDLVILNERASSYVQDLQIALETLVRTSQSRPQIGESGPPGHIFVLRADLISPETRALLASVARVVLVGQRGRLADQLDRVPRGQAARLGSLPRRALARFRAAGSRPPLPDLEFFNGLGGFADSGREYVTILGPGQSTPAPWINVIANPAFGFQVSAEGGGYTWSVNSREHQLTPWSNDPVTDRPGEAFYLRDDETGDLWSPTALPIRDEAATYVARHGRGYSRFEHASHGIAAELLQYVPLADPIEDLAPEAAQYFRAAPDVCR